MPLLSSALLLLSLLACGDKDDDDTGGGDGGASDGGQPDGGTSDGGTSGDGGGDGGGGDGGGGDGGGTGDGGGGDGGGGDGGGGDGGGGDGGTEPAPVLYTELSWRLHEDFESLVYVSWVQDGSATVHVSYSFDEGEWHDSPSFFAVDSENEQLLVGIPYDVEVQWKIVDEDSGVETEGEVATTGRLPRGLPEASLEVSEPDRWLPEGNFLLTSVNEETGGWTGGHYWTVILDRQARPVWASEAPSGNWTLFAQVSVTGDYFMWDEATYWSDWDDGAGSSVHRTWLDAELDEIETPGLHHAFVQLPDETLAWGSQDHGGGEALVEQPIGATDQTIVWTVSGDWPGAGSYQESNGLYYSPERNTYLYSFYTNNSIVEVDRETGESLWWAGDVRNGYDIADGSLSFSWQHGISWTDAGTLLLSSSNYGGGRSYTPAIEYEVDFKTETLTEVWSYNPGVHADTNGDTWRLSNGNTLHIIGSSGHLMEVDPDGEPVWHLDYDGTHLLGRGELIEDLYDLVSPDARH